MTSDEPTAQVLLMLEDAIRRVRRDGAQSVEMFLVLADDTACYRYYPPALLAGMVCEGGVQ